jgi:hypothetical protein
VVLAYEAGLARASPPVQSPITRFGRYVARPARRSALRPLAA